MSLLECEQCHRQYPLEAYKHLGMGQICNECVTGRDMSTINEAMKEKTKSMLGELVKDEIGTLSMGKVKSVVGDIYEEFGGTKGFASHFYWVIDELSKRKPLPPSVGQLMLNFMKLHLAVEQTDEVVAAREMSDEQLKKETQLATVQMVIEAAADPEKRKALESILIKHGLKIEDADPVEMMQQVAEEVRDGEGPNPDKTGRAKGRNRKKAEGVTPSLPPIGESRTDLPQQGV